MTEPTPSPAPLVRPVRMRRWLVLLQRYVRVVLLVVVLGIAAIVGWLQSADFEHRAIELVETALEAVLGEDSTITGINARYWPPGITAIGVHVFHHATGDTIVSAERVRVPIRPLWSGGIELGEIQLHRPVLHLHIDENGQLREFRNRLRSGNSLGGSPRLPFAALRVVDGSLRLDTPEATIAIDHLTLDPGRQRLTDVHADVTVRVRDFVQQTHLAWPNVRIGPTTIEVPHLAVDTAALSLGGSVHVELGGPLELDLAAQVRLEELQDLLGGAPRNAYGLVDLDVLVEGPPDDLTARVHAEVPELNADVPGVLTPLLTFEFGALTVDATASREGIEVHELMSTIGGSHVTATASIDPDLVVTTGRVTGTEVRLEPLLRALDSAPTPWVDFAAVATVDVTGPLTPPDLSGAFEVALRDLTVADRPIRDPSRKVQLGIPSASAHGTIRLNLADTVLHLESSSVRTPRNRGSVVADIGLGPRGPLDLTFELHQADLADLRPLNDVGLKGTGTLGGRLWGPFNELQIEGLGTLEGFEVIGIPFADRLTATVRSPDMKSLILEDARATVGQTPYAGAFAMDFRSPVAMRTDIRIDDGRIEDVTGLFIDLDGLRGELAGTLHLDGPLYELDGGALLQLTDVDLYGETFPRGVGRGFMEEGHFTLDELSLQRHEPTESITVTGTVVEEWALDMDVKARGIRVERLDRLAPTPPPLTGTLSADIHLGNTLMDPAPDGSIRLRQARWAGTALPESRIDLTTRQGTATVLGRLWGKAMELRGTVGLWGEQPYDLTATMRKLPAHLLYPTAANGEALRAELGGAFGIRGNLGPAPSPVAINGTVSKVEIGFEHHVLRNGEGPWQLRAEGSHFWMTGINLQGPTTQLDLQVASTDELALSGGGRVDLDLLRAVVPGLTRSVGSATLDIKASGRAPRAEVTLEAEMLRHESAPLTFEAVEGVLRLQPRQIVVENLHGRLGGGTITVQGRIDAENWVPRRYALTMDVDDAQVQWLDSLPPAVGSGSFRFDGPVDHLLLSGGVRISEMDFVERLDWEDWVVSFQESMLVDPGVTYDEPPMFSLSVDLEAPRTIRIRNNMAEATATADLRIIGDTNRPGMVGTVTVIEGLAFLQDREFRIDRGNVIYRDPFTWDPQLDLAFTTDIDSQDQRYHVTYEVLGPLSNWRTATHSEPSLAQSDVNALLWFGVTLEELEERGELSAAVASGVGDLLLTDFLISGQAGRSSLPGLLQIDRIDLATGVNVRGDYSSDPRLVVDKRLREFADIDLTWEMNLRRPDESYLSAEKRIGGRWSLSGWYATLQRDRVLPIGGAYGVDVSARWEIE